MRENRAVAVLAVREDLGEREDWAETVAAAAAPGNSGSVPNVGLAIVKEPRSRIHCSAHYSRGCSRSQSVEIFQRIEVSQALV